jgi:hypothetical protein
MVRLSKTLRLWVEHEASLLSDLEGAPCRSELISRVLATLERRGHAMRRLDRKGRVVWRATPKFRDHLADLEADAEADFGD